MNIDAMSNNLPRQKFQRFNTQLERTGFCDTLERSRYEYVRRVTELQKRRVEMEEREEMDRRVREAQFPQSVREYHAMSSRAAQLRVARFLMADPGKKDQMSTQSGWAWRQTEPLVKEYKSDVSLSFPPFFLLNKLTDFFCRRCFEERWESLCGRMRAETLEAECEHSHCVGKEGRDLVITVCVSVANPFEF